MPPTSILVVEDSSTQREMLQHALTGAGYTVHLATNGREALENLDAVNPALVISDIVMPEMNGYALCREIKKRPNFRNTPFVLMTSLSDVRDVIEALECGADNFVGKPFAGNYLLSRIATLLANRELRTRETPQGVDVIHEGQRFVISSERRQIVDLLLSVYDAAVRRNADLQAAQNELRTMNANLEKRFMDRTAKLRETNDSLETFCYSIAHDLGAPLRSIQGYIQILTEDYGKAFDATATEYANRTIAAAQRMQELIHDLLTYGKVSRGELNLQAVDIEPEIRGVLANHDASIKKSGARVSLDLKAPQVWASRVLFLQAINNLVGNALKFGRPGVPLRILITSRQVGDRIEVAVQDNGVGISPAYHEKIFNVFEKLDLSPENPGNGIGLALVRKAAERMNGRIEVDSAENRGARFALWLPAAVEK